MAEELTQQELEESNQGLIQEEFPSLVKRSSNDVLEIINKSKVHNASITIGRDQPAGLQSGYGQFPKSKNGDKCSTIDIVVGRYSNKAGTIVKDSKGNITEDYGKESVVGNNIQQDAARIYISQKTDIDDNFLLTKTGTLFPAVGKSAIGMKADNLRFVSRESIKIVSNCGELNSLGKKESRAVPIVGIQLLTGTDINPNDIQSIGKAENIRYCLEKIIDSIDKLTAQFYNHLLHQIEFNRATAMHDHLGHFRSDIAGSVQVINSIPLMSAVTTFDNLTANQVMDGIDKIRGVLKAIPAAYLNPSNSKKYIGSLYNKTN
jgi:hypothetical protein